jgi:hypothetical protein
MILLSDQVHSRFAELASDLTEFDESVRGHERRFLPAVEPADDGDPALSLEEKSAVLLYSVLARARLLSWTIAHCINGNLSVGGYLGTRAHFEMTAITAYALRQVKGWRSGAISPEVCDARIVQLTLGRRVPFSDESTVPSSVSAINVLTMLDAVDDIYGAGDLGRRFKKSYEWLSEFCHPNAFAHAVIGRCREGRRMRFEAQPEFIEMDLSNLVGHANLTFNLFLDTWDFLDDAIHAA